MKNWWSLPAVVWATVAAPAAHAQDADLKVGDTSVIPSVVLGYYAADNAFRQGQNPVEETGFLIAPTVRWEASQGRNLLSAQYTGDFYRSSEESLERNGHTLLLQGTADATSRHRLAASLSLVADTEDYNQGFSRTVAAGTLDELVSYRDITAVGAYTFGSIGAKGNVRFILRAASRSYLNQDALTSGGDFTILRPAVDFSYRVGGDSRAFVEFRHATVEYDDASSDRTELTALVGMRFNENRKLSGDIGVGVASVDRDQGSDDATTIVEVGLSYDASSFSRFDLAVDRQFFNGDGQASLASDSTTIQTNATLSWDFDWSSKISTTASVDLTNNSRTCDDNDNTLVVAGIEAQYQFRRWLSFGVGIDQESNSVDLCTATVDSSELSADNDYERVTANVFLRASL